MFKRLNLANVYCEELRIATHMTLSRALAERIVAGSHGHKKRNVPDYALYGCIYKLDGAPHTVRAHASHVERREYHVEFRYIAEKWPRPPKGINSPEILATILTEEPQEITLECDACFLYHKGSGWRSVVEIPMRLAERRKDKEMFTHIEAVRLSKRYRNQIQYSVQVERTREGDIRHSVYFTEVWTGILSEELPKQLLERSAELSRAFLSKEGEE